MSQELQRRYDLLQANKRIIRNNDEDESEGTTVVVGNQYDYQQPSLRTSANATLDMLPSLKPKPFKMNHNDRKFTSLKHKPEPLLFEQETSHGECEDDDKENIPLFPISRKRV